MTWRNLAAELDRWSQTDAPATFWWRDDDAVAPSPQLERLLQRASRVPIGLAVIPGRMVDELVVRLEDAPSVSVLQHGWRHEDRGNGPPSEYPAERPDEEVLGEFRNGRGLLVEAFGAKALPVFVPPWHGFHDRLLSLLPHAGLAAISRKGPRSGAFAAAMVYQANAHASLLDWRPSPPAFGEEDRHLAVLIDHLQGRRLGAYDRAEPTGLLTHHLFQDERSYAFIDRLLDLTLDHPAVAWLAPPAVFQPTL